MAWRIELAKLEHKKDWDNAIAYMIHIVSENKNNMDVYVAMIYLLMNLLVEEEYDTTRHDYYAQLLKQYFDESYAKFSNDPAYLFYVGRIACMSEWYLGITLDDTEKMLNRAMILDPANPIYQWTRYADMTKNYVENRDQIIAYSALILQDNSPLEKELRAKGALGEYIWSMMKHWAQRLISKSYL